MYNSGLEELYARAGHDNTVGSIKVEEEDGGHQEVKKWKKGDKCLALFKGDQLFYPAEVMDVQRHGNRVVYNVRYTEFDKRDPLSYADVGGDDLMSETEGVVEPVETSSAEQPEKAEKGKGKESDKPRTQTQAPRASESTADLKKGKKKDKKAQADLNPNVQSLLQSFASSSSSQAPPALALQKSASTSVVPHNLAAAIPSAMPFPPNMFKDLGPSSTEEALSNYIMSTYMNGYHSGYYQALKDMEEKAKKGTK
uniref:Tudor domain-containing protein n=1 Tax=Steinernema glaseri TaxID=37863 RepID=A0A1I8A719_9BILA